MVYQWKINTHSVDAQTAGEVCRQLEETVGLTAKNLLDASRPPDAPLHKEFEWDDSKAAEMYREDQARTIIRHLVIKDYQKPSYAPIRAFFRVQDAKSYESTEVLLRTEDKHQALLQTALKELNAFRMKYAALEELCDVFKAIEEATNVN